MTQQAQSDSELSIFDKFIISSGISVDRSSIKKMNPPAPDIECKHLNGGTVAYELVEILDAGFKRTYEFHFKIPKMLYAHLGKIPEVDRAQFRSLYANADILVNFRDGCSAASARSSVPGIFSELLRKSSESEGLIDNFSEKSLSKSLLSISVQRGAFCGPLFNVQALGWSEDPCIPTIQGKLAKKYTTQFPIELIAYVEGNPMFPDEVWKPNLVKFLDGLPSLIPFRKIWVLDVGKSSIELDYGAR